ncbi:MAG: hypothetical protein KDD19_03170 [Phaeodactylibacter sp.]|nr:hypothetical protein [Phaeodactylibacter sp.]MCB9053550.1 hypothetical protein [Lewinellaceae bacterium]
MAEFQLGSEAYDGLLNLLNNQHFTEKPGSNADMAFLSDDWWLQDTAVVDNVVKRAGMWEIQLVFAHYRTPQKLIKRIISRHASRKKALLMAGYMRRLAAKDQRGTLQVDIQDFGLCST